MRGTLLCTCLLVVHLQQQRAKQMPPPPFKALKGAAVKLLACRTRGPGINPGIDSSNSVIVYLLLLFLCVIQFGRENGEMERGGGLVLKMPHSEASGQ